MHAEMLIENFDALTTAPGGLTKLRSLILALAMRGMLTAQQDGDDSAAALETAALKLVSAKTRKHFAEFEPFHSIPRHWKWVRLGAISTYSETTKIEPDANLSPETWVLELEDIEKETSALIRRVFYQDRNFQSTKNYFEAGYVLYGKLRPYLDKVLVADQIGVCTTEIIPFKPLVGICPHFIRWCLKSPDFIRYADNATHGMSLPRLGTPAAINAPMPLPPLAEQRRIVAKVDELMALCDRLEAKQNEDLVHKRAAAASMLMALHSANAAQELEAAWALLIANEAVWLSDGSNAQSIKSSLANLAVKGTLTSNSVEPVPVEIEYERLKAERLKLLNAREISARLGKIEPAESAPFAIPAHWKFVRLGELAKRIEYGTSEKTSSTDASGIPTYGMGQIQDGQLRERGVKFLQRDSESLPKLLLQNGDILFNRTNSYDLVGKTAVFRGGDNTHSFASYLIRVKLIASAAIPEYVSLYLNSQICRQLQIEPEITQQTNQANYNGTKLGNILIPFPPLAEQQALIASYFALIKICDDLQQKSRKNEQLSAALLASLISELKSPDPGGSSKMVKGGVSVGDGGLAISSPQKPQFPVEKAALHSLPTAAPVDTKFQEAALVGAIVKSFFADGGEPIGNFRLQKAVYFARRHNADPSATADFLKKAAGPYNPSMKYSGGIAIAKAKSYITEARGRYGFGHIPGSTIAELEPAVERYGYGASAAWVNQHFKFKKNEEWELLATVDYAMLQVRDATPADILAYVANDPEWRPKIEKLGLTEFKIESAMLEIRALFPNANGSA